MTPTQTLGLPPAAWQEGVIEAVYDYRDESGRLLFQSRRLRLPNGDKTFKQGHRDAKGEWVYGIAGIRRVLYRLPELLEAIRKGESLLIPEGEKDVDRLRALGYHAACNPMGAGKWHAEYDAVFTGAEEVIILADQDTGGRQHADTIARHLHPWVPTVKVVHFPELPEHGDVSDWLDLGHTVEDLNDRLDHTPEFTADDIGAHNGQPEGRAFPRLDDIGYTLRDLQQRDIPDLQWAVEDLLPEGLAIIAGPPGLGKSMLLLQISLAVALDGPLLGVWQAVGGEVLYVGTEDNERRMAFRVAQLLANDQSGAVWPGTLTVVHEIQGFDAGLIEQVEEWLTEHRDARLVVIDIFADVKPPRSPHSDWYQEERRMGKALDALAMRHHVCILVSMHTNRLQHAEDPIDRVHGGSGLPGVAPTKTVLLPAQGFDKAIWHTRGRDTPREQHALTMVEGVWTYTGEGKVAQLSEERQAILTYFVLYPGHHTAQEVADKLGKNPSTTGLLLRRLTANGFLRKVGYGKYQLKGESKP